MIYGIRWILKLFPFFHVLFAKCVSETKYIRIPWFI